jgi:hypothetical protein
MRVGTRKSNFKKIIMVRTEQGREMILSGVEISVINKTRMMILTKIRSEMVLHEWLILVAH